MFKSTKSRVILLLIVAVCVIGYIGSRFSNDNETNQTIATDTAQPQTATEQNAPMPISLGDGNVLYHFTESELRREINESESDIQTITKILYRARWNTSKPDNDRKYGRKWTEMVRKYKPVIGEKKVWAIMNLADHDFSQGYHEILGYIGSRFSNDNETNQTIATDTAQPQTATEQNAPMPISLGDGNVLYHFTESELRREINESESDIQTITKILYRARWNTSKPDNDRKYGRKWTEMVRKYKPVIGEKKVWAIMNLADHDFSQGYHEILGWQPE